MGDKSPESNANSTGYSKYINKKNQEQEGAFQGRCKGLKGVVFDVTGMQDTFSNTVRIIAKYVEPCLTTLEM